MLNQFGDVLGVYRILRVLTERKAARTTGKYAELEPAHYTDDDYERIDAIYESEQPRGAEKRYWEDVNVGDPLPPMVKGPLTVTEIIAFHAGGYGFVPYGLQARRGSATRTGSGSHPSTSRTSTACGTSRNGCTGTHSGQRRSAIRSPTTTACCASRGSTTTSPTGAVTTRSSSR